MSESDTEISSAWELTDFSTLSVPAVKERSARSAATRLLLSRLPVIILAAASAIDFLLHQLPELAGVGALAQVGKQASVLVWATLPGLGGAGAAGIAGVFLLLASIGAVALAVLGQRPVVPLAAAAAGALVIAGIAVRLIGVLLGSWSPMPAGGLLFGVLIAVTAAFAAREIMLVGPAAAASGSGGRARWRATPGLLLIAVTWIGAVAVGRYFEPGLVAAIRAAGPAMRWHYLGDKSSWWLYLLGMLVVLIGYAVVQLLPPWGGRAKQIVIAAVLIIASVVAFQQAHPHVGAAAQQVAQYGPSSR